jgi:hypothetical protein
MSRHVIARLGRGTIRAVLLVAGSAALLSACVAVPEAPNAGQAAVASSSQAADGPQTSAWTMQ